MGHRRFFLVLLPAGVLLSAAAAAEPQPVIAPPASPPSATEPAALPDIKDPMLVPLPPAEGNLGSWKQAIDLVRSRSTTLRISRAQVEQAEGVSRQAWATALPRLTGNANLTQYLLFGKGTNLKPTGLVRDATIPDPSTRFNASLGLDQPLIAFGSWYSIGTAKERIRAAELGEKDAQRVSLAAVAQAAVAEITATRVAESSRVSLGSALSTLDLTRRRAQLGAASAVDVLRADQEVSLSRAQVVSADEALRQAREALGASLGETRAWAVAPDIQVDDLARTTAQVCRPVDNIDTRADILAMQKTLDAAKRDRNQVDYLYAPTLDLVSSLSYAGTTIGSPDGKHVNWTVGGALVWPLFDGGDRYGQAKVREAQVEIARQQLIQQKRDLVIQVVRADRAVVVAEANVQVATQARDIAKESARLSRLAFMNGSGTSFDLVDSARRLREAEISLLIQDFGVFQAKIAAYLARANCSI